MVTPIVFKLKRAKSILDAQPNWGDLTSKIAKVFNISSNNVAVIFIDAEGELLFTNEEELQSFYESSRFDLSYGNIKFVVLDLQTPDCESAVN